MFQVEIQLSLLDLLGLQVPLRPENELLFNLQLDSINGLSTVLLITLEVATHSLFESLGYLASIVGRLA